MAAEGANQAPVSSDLHAEAIVIDAVCPLLNDDGFVDWWIDGGVTAAAPSVGGSDGIAGTMRNLARWNRLIKEDERLRLVRSATDIEEVKRQGQFGIIYHFQGTSPIEDDLDIVDIYKQLGVGMIQLAYNVKNRVGDGAEERTDAGLSKFGMRLIQRLNEARIVVDCTHTGYRTTMDAIDASAAPVVFSHSNSKAIKDCPRNITDEQIKAVAETGGLVGIVGFPAFVSDSTRPTLDDYIKHIDYVVNLVGIDHVGLGLDYFHGQVGVEDVETATKFYRQAVAQGRWDPRSYPPPPYYYPEGLGSPREFPNLTQRLVERGYRSEDVKKIVGGNWVRVFRAVWGN